MQEKRFPILKALKGFKMATGASAQEAERWATANQQKGAELISKVFSQAHVLDAPRIRSKAFQVLKRLAEAK